MLLTCSPRNNETDNGKTAMVRDTIITPNIAFPMNGGSRSFLFFFFFCLFHLLCFFGLFHLLCFFGHSCNPDNVRRRRCEALQLP